MSSDYNYRLLQKDIKEGKQIVLFLGAGINYCYDRKILWADVMKHLFKSVILGASSENDLTEKEMNLFLESFGILDNVDIKNEPHQINEELLQYIYNEFPFTLQTYIVKKYLGQRYIPIIRDFIYGQIGDDYIKKKLELYHKHTYEYPENFIYDDDIYGLYEIARFILLCPNVKAVVTYNYDNLLTKTINIIQNAPNQYFNKAEMDIYKRRLLQTSKLTTNYEKNENLSNDVCNIIVEDIYGNNYSKSLRKGVIPIYHVHGYIPSPNEIQQIEDNSIVLSMDEYYDNLRNVYCWQTDSQMHFLSHYTCVFIGSSMSDLTIQRMLYNVQQHGNNDRIYCFQAKSPMDEKYSPDEKRVYNILQNLKRDFFKSYGVSMIYNSDGYRQMYKQIDDLIYGKR